MVLNARTTVPCAGEYVIVGKNWEFTKYLHTPTPSEIYQAWVSSGLDKSALKLMSSSDQLDLASHELKVGPCINRNYTHSDRVAYSKLYQNVDYVIDKFTIPDELHLSKPGILRAINKANVSLINAQQRFNSYPPLFLILEVEGVGYFCRSMRSTESFISITSESFSPPYLLVKISYCYLFALFAQHVHWNNLEIGNHVQMFRDPDQYDPDIHLLLSFLHF